MSDFESWEGELVRLTRTNPYRGELHYAPNTQFHLFIKVGNNEEQLLSKVIYDNDNMFNFYDSNGNLIIAINEFDYGERRHEIEFREVGEYLKPRK